MLALLSFTREDELYLDKLRIWDFYLTFPNEVRDISFPKDLRPLKEKIFKDRSNPYEDLSDPKRIFERMRTYQLSAIKCLAVYGFVDSNLLSRNKIKKTNKEIPKELQDYINNLPHEKVNVIKLVTSDFVNLPLFGDKGLKARTGLIEFKYDPR
ncbi:MAG TPA: ABC-three component system middle component 5 [Cyclobacteriaceae bacterium]|jgi:hypothetical protein|nr:ABC-three component system middle component 5 [Cyclobacteriaceae bacterium]